VGLACQPRLTRQRPRQVLKLRRAGYDVNAAAQDATSPSAYAAEHAKVRGRLAGHPPPPGDRRSKGQQRHRDRPAMSMPASCRAGIVQNVCLVGCERKHISCVGPVLLWACSMVAAWHEVCLLRSRQTVLAYTLRYPAVHCWPALAPGVRAAAVADRRGGRV